MRKWGQHLLIDERVAKREVDYAEITKSDTVLEIGPGKGILTKILAERASKVIAIEIDKRFVNYLEKILPENVEIIHADVMDIDLREIQFDKVVSNLPFEISSPITFKLLETNFSKAVIIYQKEFAKRIVARPRSKDYSRLSVVMYYKTISRILETVPKTAFRPIPKVDGAIVEIVPRESPAFFVMDENFFYEFLNRAFSNRRKTLGKIVKNYYGIEIGKKFYKKRVEELEPEEIGELCNYILERI